MMKTCWVYLMAFCVLIQIGCSEDQPKQRHVPTLPVSYSLNTDKAAYNPGEEVKVTVTPSITGTVKVRYKHLNETIEESEATGSSWNWQPPSTDFRGYMVELVDVSSDEEKILSTIAVDVSSDWTKFPRYGFLSKYPQVTDSEVTEVMNNLNRHHINGIQYYDWHYKHHQPLAGTAENPTPVYNDIINRTIHLSTITKYIASGHERNMKAMFYNLVYGALEDAATAGVDDEWYVYTDQNHSSKDKHPLSSPFISDIFVTDPSNTEWQTYLVNENRKVYSALDFDGFHMDQLGDRGNRYRYNGTAIDLSKTFKPFIEAIRADAPDKAIAFNAVNQYGQSDVANAPVDFLYTEVWGPNDTYADLVKIIHQNNSYSNNTMNTVLAAYMNYDLADNQGYFNTASVLMTNAVIFAFGGSHLELGEHMLGKEYFPNSNLAIRDDLKRSMVSYYDFLVGYQNLLRDGGLLNTPSIVSADNRVQYNAWPAQAGKVSVSGKEIGNKQVIHLLNFTNAKTMLWRDNGGIQAVPASIENVRLRVNVTKPVARVWYASPDLDHGASHEVEFTTAGNQISFTVPWLQYWDMIVVEYQ